MYYKCTREYKSNYWRVAPVTQWQTVFWMGNVSGIKSREHACVCTPNTVQLWYRYKRDVWLYIRKYSTIQRTICAIKRTTSYNYKLWTRCVATQQCTQANPHHRALLCVCDLPAYRMCVGVATKSWCLSKTLVLKYKQVITNCTATVTLHFVYVQFVLSMQETWERKHFCVSTWRFERNKTHFASFFFLFPKTKAAKWITPS